MAAAFADEPVTVWLMSPDKEGPVRTFIGESGGALRVVLDDQGLYGRYDRATLFETYAPYPLHVVLDGEGVIRWMSTESEPQAVREVIEGLLAEGAGTDG